MKLVELLANVISEWPKGAVYAVQDGDKRQTIKFGVKDGGLGVRSQGHKDPVWQCDNWAFTHHHDLDHDELADDYATSIVTRAQWQAERDKQTGGEWKRHRGGWMPTGLAGMVEVKLRCGDIQRADSHALLWRHEDCDVAVNIMKYRVISQPQAEEVEVNDIYAVDDTDHGQTEVQWTEAKTDQIDGPIKWRDTVNELDAYIEEFTREREALINRLALEGFALLPAMAAVMGVADVDMGDWRNWMAGDIVECVNQNGWVDISKGSQYTLNKHDFFSFVDDVGENRSFAFGEMEEGGVGCDFKFIRRP